MMEIESKLADYESWELSLIRLILLDNSFKNGRSKHHQEVVSELLFLTPGKHKLEVEIVAALCIIGSGDTSLYSTAFDWLKSWELVGGPYWIIQQELLRHAVMTKLFTNVEKIKYHQQNKEYILDGVTDILNKDVNNSKLILQLALLRNDISALSKEIFLSVDMTKTLNEYSSQYPLSKFINWTLAWGNRVLKSFLSRKLGNDWVSKLAKHIEVEKNRVSDASTTSSTIHHELLTDDVKFSYPLPQVNLGSCHDQTNVLGASNVTPDSDLSEHSGSESLSPRGIMLQFFDPISGGIN